MNDRIDAIARELVAYYDELSQWDKGVPPTNFFGETSGQNEDQWIRRRLRKHPLRPIHRADEHRRRWALKLAKALEGVTTIEQRRRVAAKFHIHWNSTYKLAKSSLRYRWDELWREAARRLGPGLHSRAAVVRAMCGPSRHAVVHYMDTHGVPDGVEMFVAGGRLLIRFE
jgi:hypothetical protein